MIHRQQEEAFKQQIEELINGGNTKQAYDVLVFFNWISHGSGYQENYPDNSQLNVQINKIQQILIDGNGCYWAWDSPDDSDQASEITVFREKLQAMELPEIANIIYGFEEVAWRLDHDSADGRIEHDISNDLLKIRKRVRLVAEIFADKSDLDTEDLEAMRKRIQEELTHYKEFLSARWQQLFRVGAVFRITGGGRYRGDIENLLEVVGTYDSRAISPDQQILVRKRESGVFMCFDDRDSAELLPVDAKSMYLEDLGFLRSSNDGQFPQTRKHGADIRETGMVFQYQGENDDLRTGIWETFHVFGAVGTGGEEEIVIARNHHNPRVAEFTAGDLSCIEILKRVERKFITKDGEFCTYVPVLDIFTEE